MPTPVILLACGCYNPVTYMHLRMFEIAKDYLHRMGEFEVIGGIISPVHDAYGKKDLVSSTHRLSMIKMALQGNHWIKLSDYETKQEYWSRTRNVLQYHQNQVNAFLHSENNLDTNEDEVRWLPDNIRNKFDSNRNVIVKLLCGGDLLESFGTPGLWADEDIEAIIGQHGLIVITRSNTHPNEFIYNSDILTKYMRNITIVTEWIRNEISSTKIRKALRRSESVKYLIPDNVIDYIYKNSLYGTSKTKYLTPIFPTPSPELDSIPTPTNCLYICNNNLFNRNNTKLDKISIDSFRSHTQVSPVVKHPGQAVKVITESTGKHRLVRKKEEDKEVCIQNSKSCASFSEITSKNLKECKSCDENLIKFIFTKHGIQVISDVETVV